MTNLDNLAAGEEAKALEHCFNARLLQALHKRWPAGKRDVPICEAFTEEELREIAAEVAEALRNEIERRNRPRRTTPPGRECTHGTRFPADPR